MKGDMERLLEAATYGSNSSSSTIIIAALGDSEASGSKDSMSEGRTSTSSAGPADMAVEIKKLVDAATANQALNIASPKVATSSASSEPASVGETVLRTAAMMTGVGPLVTGLLKVFGSGQPAEVPALEKFSVPASVSVQAGLTRDREYSDIRYAQGGAPEALSASSSRQAQTPTIQVNIQAMDSQSFLDRQDDIARAVRGAMLHSNSLNDVVLEL